MCLCLYKKSSFPGGKIQKQKETTKIEKQMSFGVEFKTGLKLEACHKK